MTLKVTEKKGVVTLAKPCEVRERLLNSIPRAKARKDGWGVGQGRGEGEGRWGEGEGRGEKKVKKEDGEERGRRREGEDRG